MKIPITDQFLLDVVYELLDATDTVVDFLLSSRYRQANLLFGNENPIFKKYRKDNNRKKFDQLLYHLKKNNFIKVKSLEGKRAIMITKKGLSKALGAQFKSQEKKKRKDGKWLMVIFDVPQRHQKARALLMSVLRNVGYKMFQQSVWVTPYDVSEITEKLLQSYSLEKYVRLFIIEEL